MLNLLRLNQEEVEGINRQIMSNEINNFKIPKTKVWEHMASVEFYQTSYSYKAESQETHVLTSPLLKITFISLDQLFISDSQFLHL